MRRQTKKALYESIMRDVAKTVKKHLNEDKYGFAQKSFEDKMNWFKTDVLPNKNPEIEDMFYSVVLKLIEFIYKNDDRTVLDKLFDFHL